MRPRQNLIELFSTFLQFEADRFHRWLAEPRLRRSMQRHLADASQPDRSENFWALYWHKLWQTSDNQPTGRLAEAHLLAYIQEPCYWVAQKTVAGFSSTQFSLADCFQMAIARVDKIFRGFDPHQGFNFKNYASATFGSLIRETLRQQREIDICSDWGLLRKISQKRLTDALHTAGLSSDAIASYLLAWNCFKARYVPTQAAATRKLPKPDAATWTAIAQQYNAECSAQQSAASVSTAAATPETLEKWLTACAKAARAYLYPSQVSINAPKPGQDESEFLDSLPDATQTSLLSEMIAEEDAQTRKHQQAQVSDLLSNAIRQLDDQAQRLLTCYYRHGFTQQQMAEQLDMKQYTVSRRLTKARETLLMTLAQWSQETLHITPNPDLLKYTSSALDEWLKTHYSHPDLPIPDQPVESSS